MDVFVFYAQLCVYRHVVLQEGYAYDVFSKCASPCTIFTGRLVRVFD